jgi:hypothetical protein
MVKNYSRNIINYLINSKVVENLTKIEWESFFDLDISNNKKNKNELKNRNNSISEYIEKLFSEAYPNIDKKYIKPLLNILLLDQQYTIAEVLNVFFSINAIIKHLMYYQDLLTQREYNYRQYDENLTERFMNFYQNRDHHFLLNSFKTKPLEKEEDSFDTTLDYGMKIFYKNSSERRRNIYLDENCKINLKIIFLLLKIISISNFFFQIREL